MSYYAREHPYMGYRQGMHEILGPLIFVMYSDHQSLLSYLEMAKETTNDKRSALSYNYFKILHYIRHDINSCNT